MPVAGVSSSAAPRIFTACGNSSSARNCDWPCASFHHVRTSLATIAPTVFSRASIGVSTLPTLPAASVTAKRNEYLPGATCIGNVKRYGPPPSGAFIGVLPVFSSPFSLTNPNCIVNGPGTEAGTSTPMTSST